MRRFTKGIALAGLLLAAACNSVNGDGTDWYQGTYTLQGVIADAVTGQRIGGEDLEIYLVQGSEVRGPSRLVTGSGDRLLGEYAFAGIPHSLYENATYKVVVVKPGYERFEGQANFEANYHYDDDFPIDEVYNYIRNIYLFPLGSTAPNYTFALSYQGKPVPDATVLFNPITSWNEAMFNTGNVLSASPGYVQSLQATSGADGKVTFEGAALALGAAYAVQVLPVVFTDTAGTPVQLAAYADEDLVFVGITVTQQLISLSDLTPTAGTVYVASASNRAQGQITPSGELLITFNAPVTLLTSTGFGASLDAGTAEGGGAGSGALSGTQPVNAVLSGDGLSLTLSPSYATPPAATDRGVRITYSSGTALVVPRDYPAAAGVGVFSLTFANGNAPSGLVNISGT